MLIDGCGCGGNARVRRGVGDGGVEGRSRSALEIELAKLGDADGVAGGLGGRRRLLATAAMAVTNSCKSGNSSCAYSASVSCEGTNGVRTRRIIGNERFRTMGELPTPETSSALALAEAEPLRSTDGGSDVARRLRAGAGTGSGEGSPQ